MYFFFFLCLIIVSKSNFKQDDWIVEDFETRHKCSCFFIRNHKQYILSQLFCHHQFNFTINAYKEKTSKRAFRKRVFIFWRHCYRHYCLYITQFHDVIGFINILYENRISVFLFTHNLDCLFFMSRLIG